jgi:hypothetical protein
MRNDPKGHRVEVVFEREGPALQFCWPFFVAFKEYALWTSFDIEAIIRAGFDRYDSRKDGDPWVSG